MTKDAHAFLDGETVSDEPEKVEVEEAETPEPVEAKEEGAGAEEAKAEEAPQEEQTGEAEGSTPEPEPPQPQTAPLTALLDEREKRQDAQREAQENARKMRELEAQLKQLQQPKQEAPDFFEAPQEAMQFHQTQQEQAFNARMMQQSKFFAERDFGAEVVGEAVAFFDQHPQMSQQFMNHPSPFHAAVEFYQKQKLADEIGSDPEAYKARIRAEIEAELQANAKTVQPAKPKSPPPSVASAPAQGREEIVAGNGFDQLFPG